MRDPAVVFAEWRRLAESGLNARTAAARLALSEAELVASACGALATRLAGDAQAIVDRLRTLGPSKAVVRNDFAVMECTGPLGDATVTQGVLQASGPGFTIRIDTKCTASAFALIENDRRGVKRSLLLYDAAGVSQAKFVFRNTPAEGFEALVDDLRHPTQSPGAPRPTPQASPRRVGRPARLADFLERAAALGTVLDWSVANAGAALATRTAIHRVKRSDRAPWINVLDPVLDMHLHEARIVAVETGEGADWLSDEGTLALSVAPGESNAPFGKRSDPQFDRLIGAAPE